MIIRTYTIIWQIKVQKEIIPCVREVSVLIGQFRYKQLYFDKHNSKIRSTMICKSSYILLLLKIIIFICLAVIFYAFYFIDVVSKFAHRDTTLVLSQEIVDKNATEAPFITFCSHPRAKKTILEKYKLSSGVLNEPDKNDVKILVSLNKTIETLFRETTFKIGVDFELSINLWYYEADYGWKNYTGKMCEGSNNYIKVGRH